MYVQHCQPIQSSRLNIISISNGKTRSAKRAKKKIEQQITNDKMKLKFVEMERTDTH